MYRKEKFLQLELIGYRKKCQLYSRLLLRSNGFNAISPTERIYQEVLITHTNHFGSVSDSVGRLAPAAECMASKI